MASAPGKIILSGEYAVVFGYPGVAVPAPLQARVTYTPDKTLNDIKLEWDAHKLWQAYAEQIINHCLTVGNIAPGTVSVACDIPLGKGMGSSTALVIAIAKCLLGDDCQEQALRIEDAVNPGHSGLDFAVIWQECPVKFTKSNQPEPIDLPGVNLNGALLIDTGTPNEQTSELITDIQARQATLKPALETIGNCTERLLGGESLATVMRDHAKAQQELGIVTAEAKELITKIEQEGGSAKVIGAGAKSGGCGMILAINTAAALVADYPVTEL